MIYDYLIIGAGAAGLQLGLAMLEDPFFKEKKIGIIEREKHISEQKTWCYWETGKGRWDHLIEKSWTKGLFAGEGKVIKLNLDPYHYKKLDAQIFFDFSSQKIKHSTIHWINDEINELVSGDIVDIKGKNHTYRSRHVFDSRIDPAFYTDHKYKKVWQHFKGWEIKTEKEIPDHERFTMMDFRIKYKDSTSFTYVLPSSKNSALVEFTFFTPFLVKDDEYDVYLKKYIDEILKLDQYEIRTIEKGIIPMSDYPFHQHHQNNITKIGTAGGWVRPSSGYSFRNTQQYVEQLIRNLKNGKAPHSGLSRNRFRTYDTIFLDLLEKHNEIGETLFTSMYTKNNIQQIFKFLDEQSSWLEDIRMISTFEKWPFLKAAARQI